MIRIITDSSTMYTRQEGAKLGIDVAPLSVTINNKTYREYDEITDVEFLEIINQGHVPTSSQPPIGEFLELFEKYADDEVLVITMADGLSGTYLSVMGAKELSEHKNLVVINSKTLCIPHRFLVDEAIKLRDEGKSFESIVKAIQEKVETSKSFLLPQDFGYLKRGGRITATAATLGGLLKIQPIICQTEDGARLEKFGVGRNFNQAVGKVLDSLFEEGIDDSYHFCVSHAFVEEQAMAVANRIKDKFNVQQVEVMPLSCAFITQGGPKCVAIQIIKK